MKREVHMKRKAGSCLAALLALSICTMAICTMATAGPKDGKKTESPTVVEKKPTQPLDPKTLRELSLEHSRSRDALLAAEARLSLLAEKLFDSRLEVIYRGELDSPFSLARVELWLDGGLAYRKDFSKAPSVQMLKLFDGHLPPGSHLLEVKIFAHGPKAVKSDLPGYVAGSGLVVVLKEKSLGSLVFEAEQDGEPALASDAEPEASWDVEIEARFETQAKE